MITHNLFLTISFFVLILFAYSCANIEPQKPVIDFNNPQETIVPLNQALARNPDNKQLEADMGWLCIRTGEIEQGIALLVQAPLQPSYRSDYFFPSAKSPEQRKEYYLKTLNAFDENLNGTTLYYHIRDWNNMVKSHEAAILQIEKANFNIQDKEHLSHLYYGAACGYSRLRQYDQSLARLKQAFLIDPSLMSWSFQEPDLENLRNHMGYENFKNEMLSLLKAEPASATSLAKK